MGNRRVRVRTRRRRQINIWCARAKINRTTTSASPRPTNAILYYFALPVSFQGWEVGVPLVDVGQFFKILYIYSYLWVRSRWRWPYSSSKRNQFPLKYIDQSAIWFSRGDSRKVRLIIALLSHIFIIFLSFYFFFSPPFYLIYIYILLLLQLRYGACTRSPDGLRAMHMCLYFCGCLKFFFEA